MIKLVDLSRQHAELQVELFEAVQEVVLTNGFIGGKILENFEKLFAEFLDTNHVIGVSNGTAALEVALRANGIGTGDEVITVANSFFATVEAIINIGATPIFVDVNLKDGLMDLGQVESAITSRTRAIIPVHLFGHLVNLERLKNITNKFSIIVIEDAAQAHGASAEWGKPGQLSEGAAFSFYPGKNLGAWGDGGSIATNISHLAIKYSKIRDHGRLSKYEHDLVGGNYRLDSLQAAILAIKLTKLREWNRKREEIANIYIAALSERGFKILFDEHAYKSAWHLFIVRVSNREEVQDHLKNHNIESGIHYPIPLHHQPAIANSYSHIKLPITELLSGQIVSLPLHPYLTDLEIEEVLFRFLEIASIIE